MSVKGKERGNSSKHRDPSDYTADLAPVRRREQRKEKGYEESQILGVVGKKSWPAQQGLLAPRFPIQEVHIGQNWPRPNISHNSQSLAGDNLERAWPQLKCCSRALNPTNSALLSSHCFLGEILAGHLHGARGTHLDFKQWACKAATGKKSQDLMF